MKTEHLDYLKSVGIAGALRDRAEDVYRFYEEDCGVDVEDIFVSDYVKEDGTREYECLWLFSDEHAMEAKRFATTDEFDMTRIKENILYWQIKKQEYDFHKATTKSRLSVMFALKARAQGELKASGENCEALKQIFLKYIAHITSM